MHDFTGRVAADAAAEIGRLRTEWQLGDAAVKNMKFSDTFDAARRKPGRCG